MAALSIPTQLWTLWGLGVNANYGTLLPHTPTSAQAAFWELKGLDLEGLSWDKDLNSKYKQELALCIFKMHRSRMPHQAGIPPRVISKSAGKLPF